jgi:hypothetical protein
MRASPLRDGIKEDDPKQHKEAIGFSKNASLKMLCPMLFSDIPQMHLPYYHPKMRDSPRASTVQTF